MPHCTPDITDIQGIRIDHISPYIRIKQITNMPHCILKYFTPSTCTRSNQNTSEHKTSYTPWNMSQYVKKSLKQTGGFTVLPTWDTDCGGYLEPMLSPVPASPVSGCFSAIKTPQNNPSSCREVTWREVGWLVEKSDGLVACKVSVCCNGLVHQSQMGSQFCR